MSGAIEEWRLIEQAPDYEISSLGQVRRLAERSRFSDGRLRKLSVDRKRGYFRVTLPSGDRKIIISVSRAVLLAFVGPPPSKKHQAAHWDGNPQNNTPANLRWATALENAEDRTRHGRNTLGSRNANTHLTEEAVREIKAAPRKRGNNIQLAKKFGVSQRCIEGIRSSRRWKHVS